MDKVDRQHEQRRERHVQKRHQRARHQKTAQLLQVAQRLVFAPDPVQRGQGGRAQYRRAELGGDLDRSAHQDETPDRVEDRLQDDGANDHDRQHDQRVDRPAGQDAVGDLEQVDRDRQNQNVGRAGQHEDEAEVAPHGGDALLHARAEILGTGALVEGRVIAVAAARACRNRSVAARDWARRSVDRRSDRARRLRPVGACTDRRIVDPHFRIESKTTVFHLFSRLALC